MSGITPRRSRVRPARPKGPGSAGFTLMEAIIVIGILLILASISIPAYHDYIGEFRSINSSFSNRAASATANASAALASAR